MIGRRDEGSRSYLRNLVTTANTTRGRPGMSSFMERMSEIATPPRDMAARTFMGTQTLEFLKVTNDAEAVQIALTGLMMCNEEEITDAQACAYYLSALSAVFPGLENVSKQVLALTGYRVHEVTSETAEQNFITILGRIETPRLMVMIGQAILLLYKNITDVSYENFIIARTGGLKAKTGYEGRIAPGGDVVFPIHKARMIRVRLGAFQILRANVLGALIGNRNLPGPIGGMSNYLCDILAWAEMEFLVFIFDTLCVTKSPVLRDPRVQGEVRALYNAYVAVNKTDAPQYFKILQPASSTNVLLKSKFPILIAVAQTCRSDRYNTASQYVSTASSTNALVTELVEMHRAYIRERALVDQTSQLGT